MWMINKKKMKKLLTILVVILLNISFSNIANAHDLAIVNTDGDTIYYKITDSVNHTVGVTFKGNADWSFKEYADTINIPSNIVYNNLSYSVTSIQNSAFSSCNNLIYVTMPISINKIGGSAFAHCTSLISIIIPDSVTKLYTNTFQSCTSLNYLNIGSALDTIIGTCFSNCIGLDSIKINCITPPTIIATSISSVFSGVSPNIPVYVPCASVLLYRSTWLFFTHIQSYESTLTNIEARICHGTSYTENGFNENTSGIYNNTLQSVNGCDSILVLTLTVADTLSAKISKVTVNEWNNNEVNWVHNQVADHYNIYKEGTVSNVYDLVGSVDYDSTSIWVDTNSNPNTRAYRYKISAVDSCGESTLSTLHKTMHLTIGHGIGDTWNLNWDNYEGLNNGTDYTQYYIYRSVGNLPYNLSLIDSIPSNLISWTDIYAPTDSVVYYQIEIKLNDNFKSINSIRSNKVCSDTNSSLANIRNADTDFKIYPNPASDKVTVEFKNNNKSTYIAIIDMLGRTIKTFKVKPNQTVLDINLNGFKSGGYNIKVNNTSKLLLIK